MTTTLARLRARASVALGALVVASALVTAAAAPATASDVAPTPESTYSPAPDTAPNDGLRVLVIGDSITGNPGCWRSFVWRDITDAGYEVNMVGTRQVDECGGLTNAAGVTWDPDNTGISGITVAGMYVRIGRDGLLDRTHPDMVVAMLGTNDLMSGSDADYILEQYDLLVDLIRRSMPTGAIVIAAPPSISEAACPGCQAEVDAIEAALPAWAAAKSTREAPVAAVIHVADLNSDGDTHDGIHPTASGEEKIAEAVAPVVLDMLANQEQWVTQNTADAAADDDGISPWVWVALGFALLALLAGFVVAGRRRGEPEADQDADAAPQEPNLS